MQFLGLPAGALIDRLNKKTIMKCADIIRFVSYLSIPVLSFFNMLSIFQIYVVAIISGIGLVFHSISEGFDNPKYCKRRRFGERKQLYIRYSKCFGIFWAL